MKETYCEWSVHNKVGLTIRYRFRISYVVSVWVSDENSSRFGKFGMEVSKNRKVNKSKFIVCFYVSRLALFKEKLIH